MLNVAERVTLGNGSSNVIDSGFSENRKLAIQLDKMVEDAKKKGKPSAHMVDLTPAMAAMLLDRNPANRKISQQQVERFSYEIAGGRWVFNGEPIIVSDTGELNDGQHRCSAVVEAGRAISVLMIVGVQRDSRTTLDQGRARTAGDYLAMEGNENAKHLAVAANYAWQYRNRGQMASGSTNRAMKSEIMAYVEANPGLSRSVSMFNNRASRVIGGTPLVAFCHHAISAIGRREDVDAFFLALTEGENLSRGDPALYARNRLIAMRGVRDINGKVGLIFRAWNAFRRGETVSRFHVSAGELPLLEP